MSTIKGPLVRLILTVAHIKQRTQLTFQVKARRDSRNAATLAFFFLPDFASGQLERGKSGESVP